MLRPSDLNFCASLPPVSADWRSWPTSTVPPSYLDMREVQTTARSLGLEGITSSARASNFQNGRFLSSQWFPDRATSAQTNSRAPSIVLNQIDDLWSRSTFHLARDRRSSCRILACHLVAHAKLRLSCGAHPR